ncbi:MAG: hypothetical protein K9G48_06710 [Reyranella sp.]|nr:hypothetical protein [Reyranella sp.]
MIRQQHEADAGGLERPNDYACFLMNSHHEVSDLSADPLNSGLSVIYKPFLPSTLYARIVEVLATLPDRPRTDDGTHGDALKSA